MEVIGKVVCLIAMVSVLSLPAIAGSQSDSEIKDHGMQYMDCIYDAGFIRGPTSEDPTNIDSGIDLPSPLEYRNDEGSCGLSLPDPTEHEVPSPPVEGPQPPIPHDEIPDPTIPNEDEPEDETPREEEPDPRTPTDPPIKDIPDSKFDGPKVGIPINKKVRDPGDGDDDDDEDGGGGGEATTSEESSSSPNNS